MKFQKNITMKQVIKTIVVLFITTFSLTVFSQKPAKIDKLMAAKKEYILGKLALDESITTEFWTLYEENHQKRAEHRLQLKSFLEKNNNQKYTDKDASVLIKEIQMMRQKEMMVEREYIQKYIKILGPAKALELYFAEQEFKGELIKKINRPARPQKK